MQIIEEKKQNARKQFIERGHIDVNEWAKEGNAFRAVCMNCGASVFIYPDENEPSFVAEMNVQDKSGEIYHCLKLHEYERVKSTGRL